jgi:hypothetical protein
MEVESSPVSGSPPLPSSNFRLGVGWSGLVNFKLKNLAPNCEANLKQV